MKDRACALDIPSLIVQSSHSTTTAYNTSMLLNRALISSPLRRFSLFASTYSRLSVTPNGTTIVSTPILGTARIQGGHSMM